MTWVGHDNHENNNNFKFRAMRMTGMINPNRACITNTGERVDTGARTLSYTWEFGYEASRRLCLYLYYACPCADTSACVSAHQSLKCVPFAATRTCPCSDTKLLDRNALHVLLADPQHLGKLS